ncbi:L-histidine N(alpha)-methyltransferase [Xanthobacter dioxanivorans]|uniref:L-histidine N(Alpha)-methyltransferase n=1 Tax=Xanthobacter dioxanivorans TaxID=2528964 RepID=A0A974SHX6_9HYPH|nr:L-histidine N(alpha)-methyltransferase [Xanthobacter dioxanivorans]QRG05589.1 L-histidine N(alpha)-methyltransferase [Xanthobacter dioxanivorans]
MTDLSTLPRPQARPADAVAGFCADVLAGLAGRPKAISPKYFYDEAGSRLFDRICRLPEYYPTRTELEILSAHAGDIGAFAGAGAALVEFGSGSSEKVRLLLDAMQAPAAYVPIDISGPHMRAAIARLARAYPAVAMQPVEADFTRLAALPPIGAPGRKVGFFPGSTIGNFTPEAAAGFLAGAGAMLGAGAAFVVGFDLAKDAEILDAAYNDNQGVTAAFNLNLLARINRELGADFDLAGFRHRAFYDPAAGRVEMHLESLAAQTVRIAGTPIAFARGETIHTENSYKYAPAAFAELARGAGWRERALWTDARGWFAVALLERG